MISEENKPVAGQEVTADVIAETSYDAIGLEGAGEAPGAQATAQSDVEKRAYEKGWRPEKEYEGEDWIDAKEFMGRAPLFDSLSKQGKQLKKMQSAITQLTDHNKKIDEAALNRANKELLKLKTNAYETGDFGSVVEIEQEQKRVQEASTKIKQTGATEIIPGVFEDWLEGNAWYKSNEDMRTWADGYGKTLHDKEPDLPLDELFEKVTVRAKKVFPTEFGVNTGRIAAGGMPSGKVGGKTGASKGYSALTPDQRKACDNFVELGVMTEAEYCKQIEGMGD